MIWKLVVVSGISNRKQILPPKKKEHKKKKKNIPWRKFTYFFQWNKARFVDNFFTLQLSRDVALKEPSLCIFRKILVFGVFLSSIQLNPTHTGFIQRSSRWTEIVFQLGIWIDVTNKTIEKSFVCEHSSCWQKFYFN